MKEPNGPIEDVWNMAAFVVRGLIVFGGAVWIAGRVFRSIVQTGKTVSDLVVAAVARKDEE